MHFFDYTIRKIFWKGKINEKSEFVRMKKTNIVVPSKATENSIKNDYHIVLLADTKLMSIFWI